MTREQQDSEQDPAETKRDILLGIASLTIVLGLGWGLTALFGYHWILVDFEAAPKWSVVTAFVAMPITSVLVGFAVGDGSVIEMHVKAVIVGASFWALWGHPSLDPILLATACGLAAMILGALTGRVLELTTGYGKQPCEQEDFAADQTGKAESRQDDEAH